jgi:hypothetical protein
MATRILIRSVLWCCLVGVVCFVFSFTSRDTLTVTTPGGQSLSVSVAYGGWTTERKVAALAIVLGVAGITLWEWRQPKKD